MIENKENIFNYLDQLMIKKLMENILPLRKFTKFKPNDNYSWFEKKFCKNLIEHIKYLEDKIPKTNVKWRNYK